MFPIEKCQKINLTQGAIYLGPSDEKQSVGYLELNPHTSLTLHNRPAIEKLTQVKGVFSMIIFNKEKGQVVLMREGDYLKIEPKNTWHIHVNPSDEIALQYWDFDGDITDIIDNIRKSGD